MSRQGKCLYCGRKRVVNIHSSCRECQEKTHQSNYRTAVSIMFNGTGEDEDRIAEKMWDALDGKPTRPFMERLEP